MTSVHWLLGMPFDVVRLDEVRSRIYAAVETRRQLVFATPNVNFLAQGRRDPRFRQDVLRTDLSLADGRPIVWMGRMIGIPFTERVAGSDLIESLIAKPGPRPLRVFFFGGEEGVAAAAVEALNTARGGLIGAGAYYPGFTSLDRMSGQDVIDLINHSGADLLVVSLGAAKGHRWIEINRHRLQVPVISHLGAVVNFVAGRVRRAPQLMQRIGLEWLWRIKEEPKLVTRYARDAIYLLRAMVSEVGPQFLRRAARRSHTPCIQTIVSADGRKSAIVDGTLGAREVVELEGAGLSMLTLRNVRYLDSAGAGWLYVQQFRRPGLEPTLACDSTSSSTMADWGIGNPDAAPPVAT